MLTRISPSLNLEKIIFNVFSSQNSIFELVREFEKNFAQETGCLRAFAVHWGRGALLLALKALNIRRGDEVIVQSYICRAVMDAILRIKARPVFVDSSLGDFNLSVSSIREKITPRTKVIIAAHLFGIPSDILEIAEITKKNKLYLIEDCAQCLGAHFNGKNIGTFGDLSFFSFGFDKPISTGEGGMLVVNNPVLLTPVEKVINQCQQVFLETEKKIIYGLILQYFLMQRSVYKKFLSIDAGQLLIKKDKKLVSFFDSLFNKNSDEAQIFDKIASFLREKMTLSQLNSRISTTLINKLKSLFIYSIRTDEIKGKKLLMNSLRASIGVDQLKEIGSINQKRNKNAIYLQSHLDPELFALPKINFQKEPAFLRFPILNRTRYKSSVVSKICKEKGFEIVGWVSALHLDRLYSFLIPPRRKDLKNAEYLTEQLLTVPVHPDVKKEDLENIVAILNSLR